MALELAEKAVALDDRFALSHSALGTAYSALGRHKDAVDTTRRAIELQPGDAESHANYGRCLMWSGAGDQAAEAARTALRLDPQFIEGPYLNLLGRSLFIAGRYEEAVEAFVRNEARGGPFAANVFKNWIAACGHLGRLDEARERAEITRQYLPDFSLAGIQSLGSMLSEEEIKRLVEGLRKTGLAE